MPRTKYYRIKSTQYYLAGVQHNCSPYWTANPSLASKTTQLEIAVQWQQQYGGNIEEF